MQEEWGYETNPFPTSTINTSVEQINEAVFADEFDAVRGRLVRDAITTRRPLSFLWSVPPVPAGEDTGLGKTGTMRRVAWTMNRDWGASLFSTRQRERLGEEAAAVACYASFDQNKITGLNAVLLQAVVYAADPRNGEDGQSIVARLRARLMERADLADDPDQIADHIHAVRARLAPGRAALRPDMVDVIARCGGGDALELTQYLTKKVSDGTRQRSGGDYFEAFFTLAVAAGVPHVIVFVDQLEDLANSATPKQKRIKEVERIRDFTSEHPVFTGFLHLVFTMHARAMVAVQEFWRLARLPRFDRALITDPYVVTLRGIQTDEQVAELLGTYLVPGSGRADGIMPFDRSALAALRTLRQGRIGPILDLARDAWNAAALRNVRVIDDSFLSALVDGTTPDTDGLADRGAATVRDARVIDDVLT
jgi:hypothetical protein